MELSGGAIDGRLGTTDFFCLRTGVAQIGGGRSKTGNPIFCKSGRSREPQQPPQKMGGEALDLLKWLLVPPGPPRPTKFRISGLNLPSPIFAIPVCRHMRIGNNIAVLLLSSASVGTLN